MHTDTEELLSIHSSLPVILM